MKNSKHEARNPKQYLNSNFQNSKPFWSFGFKVLNLFRISASLILLMMILLPFFVSAAIVQCGTSTTDPCTVCDLSVGVVRITNFLLTDIAFPLVIIVLLYGGIMWVTSGGNPEKIGKGQKAIEYAIYGLIFTFGGWIIVNEIVSWLVVGEFIWPFGETWKALPDSCG